MKNITAWMAAALLAACMAGCGRQSETKQDITLTVKTPTLPMNCVSNPDIETSHDFLNLAADKFSKSYDKANVTINVEVFDYTDENEAITGSYNTKNAVDVLYEGYFNMAAYVSDGYVVPLDDIISDGLKADISDASWAQSQKNGKTYMMPFQSMQNILIYNKELFTQCGLENYLTDDSVIQDWSINEWETILDALAEKLPDGSYPIAMYGANNQGDTHIMSFIRSHGGTVFDSDGNFAFSSPKAIQGLKWIQDGVGRGWYPPHPELLEINDCQQLFENNHLAVYVFNNANFSIYDDAEVRYGFVNFPGNIATSFITGFEVFDNGDDVKIQTAKDFVKFIYGTPELLEISAGNIPESKTVSGKYAGRITMLKQFSDNAANVVDFMNSSPNWQGNDDSVRSVFWPQIHELLAGRLTPEECAAALDRDCNAAIQAGTALHD